MSTQLSFDRLNGRENFSTWKVGARAHLISKGFWNSVVTELETSATADVKTKNEKALAEITLLVDPTIYSHLEHCKTAKEAWDTLTTSFEDNGVVRKVSLLKQWISLKLSDCASIQDYVNRYLTLRSKVNSAGFKIDEDVAGSIMLCGLPDDFRPMIMSVETSGKEITVDYVKNILLQEIDFNKEEQEKVLAVSGKKFNGNKTFNKKKKPVKCYECGGSHYKNKCPQLKSKTNVVLLAATNRNVSKAEWIIDSGASAHMTNCESFLLNKMKPNISHVTVANNNKLAIESVGDVKQRIATKGNINEIQLKNVQYIPDISTNLISVSQVVKKGFEVIFNANGCTIHDMHKNIVATGSLIDNIFKLDIDSKQFAYSAKNESDPMLWHRRFGHASMNKLKLLMNINVKDDIKCIACSKGKTARKPFKENGTRATKLLELIHSDVCGPISIESMGGAKYFVSFIDDFSKKVFVFTMKQKSEVFNKFIEFKRMVENQCETKIKKFRSDNGKEFINKNFENLFKSSGIKHEKSTPYTPQQNGVAERMNRTLIEKVRCMIYDSNINKNFWAEALLAAVDIVNALPNRSNNNKSPDFIWYGKNTKFDNFKIFGSKAMVLKPAQHRSKLDAKTHECIFLRYANDAKAFRLFDMTTKKIVISRDVTFLESETVIENVEQNKISIFNDSDNSDDDDHIKEDSAAIDAGEKVDLNESTAAENQHDNNQHIRIEETPEDMQNDVVLNESSDDDEMDSTIRNNDDSYESALDESSLDAGALDDTQRDPTFTTRANMENNNEDRPMTRNFSKFHLLNSHIALLTDSIEPKTYKQAVECKQSDKWMNAMSEEYESLIKNHTWILVNKPKNESIIDNRWVFKIKENTDGSIERYKARLVARGFTQEHGINYYETFSPVVRFTSIRIILSIAANKKMMLKQFDVKTAFLNGVLDETVYMKQPIGFDDGTDKVCQLKKSLYGLKQSSRCWNKKFTSLIESFGFVVSKSDPCVFVSHKNNYLTILAIHVDDGLIVGDNKNNVESLLKKLKEQFEIKISEVKCFLGLEIEQKTDSSIFVHQSAYAKRILQRFNMENCNAVSTPSDTNQTLYSFDESDVSNFPYRELVGSLMYLAVGTRPDIAHSVGVVSRFLEKPKIAHVNAAKRILKYLKKTINHGILYFDSNNKLTGYSDADYAGDLDSRRSTSGYIFKLGSGIISWCSERQKCVSLSTTESEYVAASTAIKELIWLRKFLHEILQSNSNDIVFYMDNQSAIRLVKNPEFHKRTKHIDVRYHFIREAYENKLFCLEYINTKNMIADVLTKALPTQRFNALINEMSITSI